MLNGTVGGRWRWKKQRASIKSTLMRYDCFGAIRIRFAQWHDESSITQGKSLLIKLTHLTIRLIERNSGKAIMVGVVEIIMDVESVKFLPERETGYMLMMETRLRELTAV